MSFGLWMSQHAACLKFCTQNIHDNFYNLCPLRSGGSPSFLPLAMVGRTLINQRPAITSSCPALFSSHHPHKAGHELTCGSPGSVPAGHVGAKTDTWIDPDPWETGTRTRGSRFGGYFPRIYLQVLAGISKVLSQYQYFYAIKHTFYQN